MAQAKRDENRTTTLLGALSTDGITPTVVNANSITNALKVEDSTGGSDFGVATAQRDENRITVLMAVSDADGITPVEVYADSSGNLLVDSN